MGGIVKVLSVQQPWAGLIVMGAKTIETRTWGTPYRGRLLIHAGKASRPATDFSWELIDRVPKVSRGIFLARGRVVGEVNLVDCRVADPGDIEKALCDVSLLQMWVLEDPKVWVDLPVFPGMLGLFTASEKLLAGHYGGINVKTPQEMTEYLEKLALGARQAGKFPMDTMGM